MKIPAIVRYNDKPSMGGMARYFLVDIKPKYKDDKGLLAHELNHVKHFWLSFIGFSVLGFILLQINKFIGSVFLEIVSLSLIGLSFFSYNYLYKVSNLFKLYSELDCYAIQIIVYLKERKVSIDQYKIDFAVNALADKYGLKITREKARSLLVSAVKRKM